MDPAQIFISYRRDDSAGYARALYDELARRWGAGRVFMDVDDIAAGQPFADVLRHAVGESEVLLVLIGPRWQGERAGQASRLHDERDFVRLEVAAALASGMQVIPVLLDGAVMPTEAQLPHPLRALAGRNALELRHTQYAADLERLLATLRAPLGATPPPAPKARRAWLAGALVLGAAGLGALGWRARQPTLPPQRPDINGRWWATVEYDWPNARYDERFEFSGAGADLQGTASFLRVPRGLLEGQADPDGLQFVTRSTEMLGNGSEREKIQRYSARWRGGELHFVLQIEGGSTPHAPVRFVARRATNAASAPA